METNKKIKVVCCNCGFGMPEEDVFEIDINTKIFYCPKCKGKFENNQGTLKEL